MGVRESRLWSWLSQARRVYKEDLHIDRVENSIIQGMPDVEGCLLGMQFWIELKCETRPKNPNTLIKPKFQLAQIPWIEKRIAAGGRAHVLLQVGQGHAARRYLIHGSKAVLLENGWMEQELRHLALSDPKASPEKIILKAANIAI
jgi:hypothetical protein